MTFTNAIGAIAEQLTARLDADGWDAPATLWSITVDALPDGLADELAGELTSGSADVFGTSVNISCEQGLLPHPVTALLAEHPVVDSEAVGVVACSEGWSYSPATFSRIAAGYEPDFSPSEDPNRQEVRLLVLVLRDGTEVVVEQIRDAVPVIQSDERGAAGMLVWTLRRVIGRPSEADVPDLRTFAKQIALLWLVGMGVVAEAVGGDLVDMGEADDANPAAHLADASDAQLDAIAVAEDATVGWVDWSRSVLAGDLVGDEAWEALRATLLDELKDGHTPLVCVNPTTWMGNPVPIDADLVAWCDGRLLGTVLANAVPDVRWALGVADLQLGRPVAERLVRWLAAPEA